MRTCISYSIRPSWAPACRIIHSFIFLWTAWLSQSGRALFGIWPIQNLAFRLPHETEHWVLSLIYFLPLNLVYFIQLYSMRSSWRSPLGLSQYVLFFQGFSSQRVTDMIHSFQVCYPWWLRHVPWTHLREPNMGERRLTWLRNLHFIIVIRLSNVKQSSIFRVSQPRAAVPGFAHFWTTSWQ